MPSQGDLFLPTHLLQALNSLCLLLPRYLSGPTTYGPKTSTEGLWQGNKKKGFFFVSSIEFELKGERGRVLGFLVLVFQVGLEFG